MSPAFLLPLSVFLLLGMLLFDLLLGRIEIELQRTSFAQPELDQGILLLAKFDIGKIYLDV